jgi:tRNA(Glu) U13 pseudouridine synthase TruD
VKKVFKALYLGDLYGNRFSLAIRFIDINDSQIEERINK